MSRPAATPVPLRQGPINLDVKMDLSQIWRMNQSMAFVHARLVVRMVDATEAGPERFLSFLFLSFLEDPKCDLVPCSSN